jgi:5-methylcytosine-specific restriction protein A
MRMLKTVVTMAGAQKVNMVGVGARAKGEGSTARGYGYKWQKARERFLSEHPLCCYCERTGRITAASVVDHKIPHRGDAALFWNESNWQPLCKPCHDSVKAREEGRGPFKLQESEVV